MNLVHNLKVDSYIKIKSKIYTFKQKKISLHLIIQVQILKLTMMQK